MKFSDDKMSGVLMSMVSLHLYMMFNDNLLEDLSDDFPENQSSHSLSMAKPYMEIDSCQV